MHDNPVADKRLSKLIQQCRTKQILDYVKQHGEDRPEESSVSEDNAQSKKKSKKNIKAKESMPLHKFIVQRHTEDSVKVLYDEHVKEIRPYILCCIVKNVNLQDGKFRKFLQIQSKLHDNENVCGKRERSTIATHDINKLGGTENYIKYTAKEPSHLKIHPLGKSKTTTALKLYNDLKAEAEALRKEKKRNVFTGIHKYLYMLENKLLFSCIEDSAGNVISLPPLINGDLTKVGVQWRSVFFLCTFNIFFIHSSFIIPGSDLIGKHWDSCRGNQQLIFGRLSYNSRRIVEGNVIGWSREI